MKILTGTLRGQAISFRTNTHLRPTSDKTRKAMMDILQGAVEGKRILDLFSGTGALGMEALSSGASQATFVELDRVQCNKLKENLKRLGIEGKSTVIASEVCAAIHDLSEKGEERFDIVFLDPPYGRDLGLKALKALSLSQLIHADTLIFLECGRKEATAETIGRLRAVKTRTYGDTKLIIYKAGEGPGV